MRTLEGHKINPANDVLTVHVHDLPGSGGACHQYSISGPTFTYPINFQNGPIAEAGINGITHEALLSILIDRLEGFQSGQFASHYNQATLDHLKAAQASLLERTQERMRRGVEGTHQV